MSSGLLHQQQTNKDLPPLPPSAQQNVSGIKPNSRRVRKISRVSEICTSFYWHSEICWLVCIFKILHLIEPRMCKNFMNTKRVGKAIKFPWMTSKKIGMTFQLKKKCTPTTIGQFSIYLKRNLKLSTLSLTITSFTFSIKKVCVDLSSLFTTQSLLCHKYAKNTLIPTKSTKLIA